MQLTEVTNAGLASEFIQVNVELNRLNANYIRPLNKDIEDVFDPKRNKTFRTGECVRWILKDEEGRRIGRIAAFVNKKYRNKGDEGPIGGIGFFDCIDDQRAADTLFDVAKHWLLQRGMTAMDGPINFGERDRWWGLVVEGFQEPLYCMNYNPPYYRKLVEDYGFRAFFNQICFGMDPKKKLNAKLFERHAVLEKTGDYKCLPIQKNNLSKYAEDFTIIYNKAWSGHGGAKEMKKEHAVIMFNKMKPVMDERIIWYVYYKDQPVAMFINLPDLNQWFKYLNGKFDLLHKLKFLWVKKTKPCKKCTGLVFGIVPEFQGKGVDAYMVVESGKTIQYKTPYTEYEMQWIGDFNPKMVNVAAGLGDVYRSRILTTYRYLFDRTAEFKPHPMIS